MSAGGGIDTLCVTCGRPSVRPACTSCANAAERAEIARDEMMRWKRSPSLGKGRL